jgi:hypothetical protein
MDVGLSVAPALVFGTGMFFLPETPRWLMHGGHHEVARRVLVRIRELADVNVEIDEIKASLAQQAEVDTGPICCVGKFAQLLSLD